jgi:hypothetical protein
MSDIITIRAANSQLSSVEGQPNPVCLPGTQRHALLRSDSDETYRIDIALPSGSAPDQGWPVIVLLDAGGCFATCVEALRRMGRRPDATGATPALIIGILPPDGTDAVEIRRRDFTTPRAAGDGPPSGGAEAFLHFIDAQVMPLAASLAPVDRERQTLFGHSLGGYFTLWALLNHPRAFRNYAAISPSVWWDRPGLLAAIPAAPLSGRRLLVCIGEWEDALPPWQSARPDAETVRARRAARSMVAHAQDMAERISAKMDKGYAQFRLLLEEDHASIVSAAIPRMLRLASARNES